MTTHEMNRWPAQEPPVEFADKAVAAMLAARSVAPRRRIERRWVAALALAAVLGAAGAWGMVEMRKAREPGAAALVPAVPESVEPPAPSSAPVQAWGPAPSASEPAPMATVTPSAPVRPRPSASAAPVPSASPTTEKKIIVPRCECAPNEGFCTCVQ